MEGAVLRTACEDRIARGGKFFPTRSGTHFTNRLILLCRLSRSSFLLRNFLIEFLKKSIRSRLASALESLRTFSFKSIPWRKVFFRGVGGRYIGFSCVADTYRGTNATAAFDSLYGTRITTQKLLYIGHPYLHRIANLPSEPKSFRSSVQEAEDCRKVTFRRYRILQAILQCILPYRFPQTHSRPLGH